MLTLFCVFAFLSPSLAAVSKAVDKLLESAMDEVTVDPEKEYECLLYRLEDKLDRLENRMTRLETRHENRTWKPPVKPTGRQYAFSAYLSVSNSGLRSSGDLKFTTAISNVGGAYNEHTGVFTAKAKGLYVFTIFAHTYTYSKVCTLNIIHNNETIASSYSYDRYGLPTFGNTVVVKLDRKDVVHVAIKSSSQCYLSGKYSTFTGFQLGD
ncbi:complement C1q subcomponent subunit C-like [Pecten maximus]|uniref:complement C1q subcomponent subunit C-like n=1 Tax=Pecten maximus TaxID=6579 RepID=UPI001458E1E3|nr:complement C1q subcomponent subunit C-like [Pecten maximus]